MARSATARMCSRSRSRSTIGTGSAGRTRSQRPPGRRANTPTPGRWAGTASTRLRSWSTVGSRATLWSRAALAGLISRGDRGAGGPNVGFSGGAVTVGAGRRAVRRRRRLACALYSARGRSHDTPRRERRPHAALYPRGPRNGPLGQMARRSGDLPGARRRLGPCRGGDRAGERGRADPRRGETVERTALSFPRKRESRGAVKSGFPRFAGMTSTRVSNGSRFSQCEKSAERS